MTTLVRVTKHERGRRVHVLHARIHHGIVGAILIAAGAALVYSDRHDFPWLSDRDPMFTRSYD